MITMRSGCCGCCLRRKKAPRSAAVIGGAGAWAGGELSVAFATGFFFFLSSKDRLCGDARAGGDDSNDVDVVSAPALCPLIRFTTLSRPLLRSVSVVVIAVCGLE